MIESWLAASVHGSLEARRRQSLLRQRRIFAPIDATHVDLLGRRLVNFASNSYLGLAFHPDVISATQAATRHYGCGAGASPLISGHGPAHATAESAIAHWKSTEAAILLPSGYQAAHAAVQTLAALAPPAGVRFLIDKLAHASLIDAVRGAGSPFRIFPHNHLGKLQRLLMDHPAGQAQVVITESIFSMDGDAADLHGICQLREKFRFALLLDEAHASGVYGPAGAGYAAEHGLQSAVDVSLVTLSKALGVAGGALCGSAAFCHAVENFGRALIYSTALPPSTAAAIEAAITLLRTQPERQQRLRARSAATRDALRQRGWPVAPSECPIIPVVLGQESLALQRAAELADAGFLVAAVRPPTVPRSTSRLRITLSSQHTDAEVERLLDALGHQ